ncbi:hypothetical protein C8J57DRAFT_1236165 [Mycena rebaudengoi]|nr:hypothetical protein C8J57DRAFT_1236165 [Mycena rebaudengoi]
MFLNGTTAVIHPPPPPPPSPAVWWHIGHSVANNDDKLFKPKAVEHDSDTVAWVVGKLENSKTVKKFDQFTMANWKYYLEQSTISIEDGKKHRREEEREREKEKEKRRCRQKKRDCSSSEENEERKKKRKSSKASHSEANGSSGEEANIPVCAKGKGKAVDLEDIDISSDDSDDNTHCPYLQSMRHQWKIDSYFLNGWPGVLGDEKFGMFALKKCFDRKDQFKT